ncbi:stage II sporulation protein M [Engelhardtia mirabilis]|uniref:RDD family protein n=1 Tax=Engelhardtia mirabilis TaxID=2528011 RepID=A0A518BNS4_9BACT|nr:RDD family protein [Planctomycetes bacterium Pla133]QDV02918.1 RDD family protein [Planctomycetes bacterium Pla86]
MSDLENESEPAPPVDVLRDRVLRIDTPERVSVEFPLAGLGSRFGALLIDGTLILLAFIVVALVVVLVGQQYLGVVSPELAIALVVAAIAFLIWGYFFFYEAFSDGQTPGKRLFGVRAVLAGGQPLTIQAAALRNLIRIIDLQPGTSCLVGGFVMLIDSRGRRLGDLVGGTVVVRELPIEFPDVTEVAASGGAPRLDDAGFEALESFVDRADELRPEVLLKLGRRLSNSVAKIDPPREGETPAEHLIRFHAEERVRRATARLSTEAGAPAAMALLRSKRSRWEELREGLPRFRRGGLRRVGEDEVAELAARYREVSADLARSRTYGASARTLFALERLVGAVHNVFYQPRSDAGRRLWAFMSRGFPALFRRLAWPIGISGLLLVGSAGLGYGLVRGDAKMERLLIDSSIIARADEARANPDADYRDTWEGAWMGSDALSVRLIANNVQVALVCFAAGLLFGLGSAASIAFNGLHLGTALAVFANRGVLHNIGLFVLPHGIIELTAIVIAGGAGMWMGSGIWFPGRRTRTAATATRAREAVSLIAGVAGLLVIAGLIEGFISPSRLPDVVKLLVAAGAATWLVFYLGLTGRGAEEASEGSAGASDADRVGGAPGGASDGNPGGGRAVA